jgi:hypothetical protein
VLYRRIRHREHLTISTIVMVLRPLLIRTRRIYQIFDESCFYPTLTRFFCPHVLTVNSALQSWSLLSPAKSLKPYFSITKMVHKWVNWRRCLLSRLFVVYHPTCLAVEVKPPESIPPLTEVSSELAQNLV